MEMSYSRIRHRLIYQFVLFATFLRAPTKFLLNNLSPKIDPIYAFNVGSTFILYSSLLCSPVVMKNQIIGSKKKPKVCVSVFFIKCVFENSNAIGP